MATSESIPLGELGHVPPPVSGRSTRGWSAPVPPPPPPTPPPAPTSAAALPAAPATAVAVSGVSPPATPTPPQRPAPQEDSGPSRMGTVLDLVAAWGLSFVVNLALLLALGLVSGAVVLPGSPHVIEVGEAVTAEDDLIPPDTNFTTTETVTSDAVSGSLAAGADGGNPAGSVAQPALSAQVMSEAAEGAVKVTLSEPELVGVAKGLLDAEIGGKNYGEPRRVVNSYRQAFNTLGDELDMALARRNVLVLWLFDESESMKNDQEEIRKWVTDLYQGRGMLSTDRGEPLLSAVASYGESVHLHTPKPTADPTAIRAAMGKIPIDESGKEMMCHSIGYLVNHFRGYSEGKHGRDLALILVTDESGDTSTNVSHLEACIQECRDARCRVFVLGREAIFGYPYAHMQWIHPFNGGVHWLPVDRGPETGFIEQLQTEGFHRRYDGFPSGFGPWEQCRLSKATGGIFFMMVGLETDIVQGQRGAGALYDLERLRPYLPDYGPRIDYIYKRDQSKLRSVIWKVVNDLNPYQPEIARYIEMRTHFSPDLPSFGRQAQIELKKAETYVRYLDAAQQALESIAHERSQETSPRWQANYDLLLAQVLAYKVRVYEYGAYIEQFLKTPKIVPLRKPPDLTLGGWHLRHRTETITGELTAQAIARSRYLFEDVRRYHPGTPWAERAGWELQRGFGIDLVEHYHGPPRVVPSGPSPPVKIPKL